MMMRAVVKVIVRTIMTNWPGEPPVSTPSGLVELPFAPEDRTIAATHANNAAALTVGIYRISEGCPHQAMPSIGSAAQ